jgi:uncharacterized membrane protein YdjX (TVP38/TMEM64 family)
LTENDQTSQSKVILITTAVLIAGLVGAYFVIPGYQSFIDEAWRILTSGDDEKIAQWVEQFGFWGPVFIAVSMTAQMFLFIVNVTILVLVSILAYGPIWGSLLAALCICIASTIGYFIGRAMGPYTVHKLIGESTETKIENFMNEYGIGAVIIARLSPFLSNDAISFVAGILKMSYWKFMGATLAGITPLIILIAWLSESMSRLKTGLIWVSAISVVAFIGYIIYDKYFSRDSDTD